MTLTRANVGSRVVVRRRLGGERGPSGGQAMTDVIGALERFDDELVRVRREDGTLVEFARADVVAGKPVPPRTSTLLRVGAEHLEAIAGAGWPARSVERLGDWLLREAGGFTGRANSVLCVGDPGVPLAEAFERVEEFYQRRGLEPLLQVVVGAGLEQPLAAAGWHVTRHGGGVLVQVASLASARRTSRSTDHDSVRISDTLSDAWMRLYGRTAGVDPDVVRAVLAGPDTVALASVGDPLVAIGRGVVTGRWLGLAAVEVAPGRRGQGIGRQVVDALLAWGSEHGARSVYLQTVPDNPAALALYEPYGFITHHRYCYWTRERPGRSPSR
ncbi:MAG: GNAT family N-acetyltransferase [Actinomycetota bacterium]|nr:GNAT family N-acetyltransferase [Actinomycetota bacterium]